MDSLVVLQHLTSLLFLLHCSFNNSKSQNGLTFLHACPCILVRLQVQSTPGIQSADPGIIVYASIQSNFSVLLFFLFCTFNFLYVLARLHNLFIFSPTTPYFAQGRQQSMDCVSAKRGSIVCAEKSMDCLDPCFAHGTIHGPGLRAQSTDRITMHINGACENK